MFLNPEWQRRVTTIRFAGSLHVLSVLVCFFFHIPMLMVDWLLLTWPYYVCVGVQIYNCNLQSLKRLMQLWYLFQHGALE